MKSKRLQGTRMLKFHTTIKIKHSAKCKLSSTQMNIIQKKKKNNLVGRGMGVWNSYKLSPALYSPQKMPSMPPKLSVIIKNLSQSAEPQVKRGGRRYT
jgi:hypothetical protein